MDNKKYLVKRENPVNKLLTVEAIETIMRSNGLDLPVNDIRIYQTAFVHRSYLKTRHNQEKHDPSCVSLQDTCNETYEYAGDTILNSVIGTYLYGRYYDQNEGFLTKTRTKMVRGTTLGELAKRIGFPEWVIISQHVENENGRYNIRILEDLFEAFIAAIYLDNGSEPINDAWFSNIKKYKSLSETITQMEQTLSATVSAALLHDYVACNQELRKISDLLFKNRSNGYLYCQKFIINAYERHIDISRLIAQDDNYKDQLQHYFQKIGDTFPTWPVIKEEGKTNNRWHTVGVRDRYGNLIGVAKSRKKADAEQLASLDALISLGVINANHENFFREEA
jgi:dsRNA-specific ribonuclease